MKHLLLALPITLLAGCCGGLNTPAESGFTVSGPELKDGAMLTLRHEFNGFDGRGQNVFPAIAWQGAPAGTRGYALTVYDPDAPTGSGWWHYVLVNLPATVTALPEGAGTNPAALPEGALEVRNDYGIRHFGGPCPPKGDKPHRYVFTIHALKVAKLDLPDDATAALAGFMIRANELGRTSVTVRYGR